MKILVLNAGSSSQKSCLYDLEENAIPEKPAEPIWEAKIDWTHHQGVAEIKVKTIHGAVVKEELQAESRQKTIEYILKTLWNGLTKVIDNLAEIQCVGHRVVHGGDKYHDSTIVTKEVKDAIADLAKFAPVHNPVNLEGIEAIATSDSKVRVLVIHTQEDWAIAKECLRLMKKDKSRILNSEF